jgi:hypothetical protein
MSVDTWRAVMMHAADVSAGIPSHDSLSLRRVRRTAPCPGGA